MKNFFLFSAENKSRDSRPQSRRGGTATPLSNKQKPRHGVYPSWKAETRKLHHGGPYTPPATFLNNVRGMRPLQLQLLLQLRLTILLKTEAQVFHKWHRNTESRARKQTTSYYTNVAYVIKIVRGMPAFFFFFWTFRSSRKSRCIQWCV